MSADNWDICPKCNKKAVDEKEKLIAKAREAYGKLPPEEYETLLFESREPISIEKTLREDYSFDMEEDGSFSAVYSAHCSACGFKYKFNHSEQVKI